MRARREEGRGGGLCKTLTSDVCVLAQVVRCFVQSSNHRYVAQYQPYLVADESLAERATTYSLGNSFTVTFASQCRGATRDYEPFLDFTHTHTRQHARGHTTVYQVAI